MNFSSILLTFPESFLMIGAERIQRYGEIQNSKSAKWH